MARPLPDDPRTWGACPSCAGAVPPGASVCPECQGTHVVPDGTLATTPRPMRYRLTAMRVLRAVAIVTGVVIVAWAMIGPALSGPPNVADPLTTHGFYSIPTSGFELISGNITGGDFVIGNFTTVNPLGTTLEVAVYNSTEWTSLVQNGTGTPAWTLTNQSSGRIVFSPPYTDLFYFVFSNPYAPSTGINITAYIVTQYESNVAGGGGFG